MNTTAVELGLGTGGWHVVHWNLERQEWCEPGPGHVMKVRYTSLQADVGLDRGAHGPAGRRRVDRRHAGRRAPGCTASCRRWPSPSRPARPDARLVYVMTDGAGLPLALSDLVADLREPRLLDAHGHLRATPSAATTRRCRSSRRWPWPVHVAGRRRRRGGHGPGRGRHRHPARLHRPRGRRRPRRRRGPAGGTDRLPAGVRSPTPAAPPGPVPPFATALRLACRERVHRRRAAGRRRGGAGLQADLADAGHRPAPRPGRGQDAGRRSPCSPPTAWVTSMGRPAAADPRALRLRGRGGERWPPRPSSRPA